MEGTRKLLVDKVSEFANLGGGGGGDLQPKKESIANFFQKILEHLLHIFDPVWGFLVHLFHIFDPVWGSFVEKFDSIWGLLVEKLSPILPDSETLHHWLHIGLTLVLPIALLFLFLYYCFRGCFRGCRGCFRGCCGCCGRGTGKMMKAPGRMGATIPRAFFEANPLGYFRALHSGRPLRS